MLSWRKLLSVAACLLGLTLAGCWGSRDIESLALIPAIAVDRGSDSGVEISLQVVQPGLLAGGGGGGGGGGQPGAGAGGPPVSVVKGAGDSVSEAIEKLQERVPRHLFWDAAELLVLGEEMARSGLEDLADFLLRHRRSRLSMRVAVVRGRGGDYLTANPPLENIPATALMDLARSDSFYVPDLRDILVAYYTPGRDPVAALVEVVSLPDDVNMAAGQKHREARWAGLAAFRDLKLAGFLSPEASRGYIWAANQLRNVRRVYLHPPGAPGPVVATIRHCRSRAGLAGWDGTIPLLTLEIRVEGDIREMDEYQVDTNRQENLSSLERMLEDEVGREVTATVEESRKLGSDVLGLGRQIYMRYPRFWRQSGEEQSLMVDQARVFVEVQARLTHTGFATKL